MDAREPVLAQFRVQPTDLFLVIDAQQDFCPGGRLAVPDGDAVMPLINQLAHRFPHVILTQDWHTPGHTSFASSHPGRQPYETVEAPYGPQTLWPDHCIQGTQGADFHPALDIPFAELVLRKGFRPGLDSYSAFFENDKTTPTGLAGYLRERGLQRVILAGLAYDYCVRYSAVDAIRAGFSAIVIEDACRAIGLPGSVAATEQEFAETGVLRIASNLLTAPA
jgi:nicotinamidase/pyrazinamidase